MKNTTWYTVKVYLAESLVKYVVYAAEIVSSSAAVAVEVRCWRAARGQEQILALLTQICPETYVFLTLLEVFFLKTMFLQTCVT